MTARQHRLSRDRFAALLNDPQCAVVYNKLGTLKYLPGAAGYAVVTSSKHEKRAVVRNKLRRRVYEQFRAALPAAACILYVSKQSYGFDYATIKTLFRDLIKKGSANS